jgi:hypothetical protein
MTSIYQEKLGTEFGRLHPKIQQRFGFCSADKIASIGSGVMDEIWYGRLYTLPFLYIGTWRNIMFPQRGKKVPFTIENYAYTDQFGRETVTWVRKYQFPKKERRFDATMILSRERQCIIDYLGTHQHLAVDIDLSVSPQGGLHLRAGEQRFYEGRIGFKFPMIFSGYADVHEWFDDATDKYKISVKVFNKTWGDLFGYNGSFDVQYIDVPSKEAIPKDVLPVREERRE